MQSKVFIRADGSTQIGLGHLVRCIALAHMLKEAFDIHFVCKELPVSLEGEILKYGFALTKIDEECNFLDLLSFKDFVVLDHYGLNVDYQKRIKLIGCKLVCIDDLHDKEYCADIIINHAPGITPKDYKAQPYTQFALGPEYALLRPAFLKTLKGNGENKLIETVLICFGGADSKNLTLRTLEIVLGYYKFKKVNVITGSAYKNLDQLTQIKKTSKNVTLFHAIDDNKMAELIAGSDLAIVPASGILLEVLAVGNKVISGIYIENQKYFFEKYNQMNAFINAEDFSDKHLKLALAKSFKQTTKVDRVVDGQSNRRILKIFKQLQIEEDVFLRKALKSDLQISYKWAIDKQIRAFSFNRSEINWEEHSTWFLSKIEDLNCYYYLVEWNKNIIGSIRFDIKDRETIISYLIDSNYHNKGLGVIILKKGINALINENNKKVKQITGFVLPQNVASCKNFEKLYFLKEKESDYYKYTIINN